MQPVDLAALHDQLERRAHTSIRYFDIRARPMKLYLLSLGAGILVGIVYSVINVRSPAPPLVALLGLLGMLIGEQAIPSARQLLNYSTLPAVSHQASGTGRLSSTQSVHAVLEADQKLVRNEEEHS
jgi:XapX domain-containing protein